MLFRRKSHDRAGTIGLPQPTSNVADVRSCPSLAKALKRISTLAKPQILDLGPLCGSTAVFLANLGARVCVEDFQSPPPLPKKSKHDEGDAPVVLLPGDPPGVVLRGDQPALEVSC